MSNQDNVAPARKKRSPSLMKTRKTRESIIKAGMEVFIEHGFADAKVSEISKKAGVAKGTVYNYFQTKESLFESVLREFIVAAPMELRSEPRKHGESVKQYLRRVLLPVIKTLESSGRAQIARLVITESVRFPVLAKAYLQEVHQPLIDSLKILLEAAFKEGELKNNKLALYPHILLSPNWLGIVHNGMLDPSNPLNIGELFEVGLDLFFDSVDDQL
ncbi:TetR/AcrR family transcriptional regulator [Shigella flexneri]|nr:TetR/AcrR family transcriptional regulator [Escherichia coli]